RCTASAALTTNDSPSAAAPSRRRFRLRGQDGARGLRSAASRGSRRKRSLPCVFFTMMPESALCAARPNLRGRSPSLGHCATKPRQTASSCFTYRCTNIVVCKPILGSFTSHQVNLQPLFGPCKERLVLASFQVLSERVLSVQVDSASTGDPVYKQMLFVGNTCLFIIDDLVVAIESKPVLHIAANTKDGNRFVGRGKAAQPVGEGARRVRTVEQLNHSLGRGDGRDPEEWTKPIEEEDENHQDAAGGNAQAGHSKAMDHHQNQQRSANGGKKCGGERVGRGHAGAVGHKPRQQKCDQAHDAAEQRMTQKHPELQAGFAAAVKVIAGKDGDR